ncbi:MAG TPA: hypothetical protein VFH54_19210 [Mycobacteriales bacterium]|nr:hypothetical protein [Mycobacteriales bacterium]
MAAPLKREDGSLPADMRDMLTRSRLENAIKHLVGVEVLEFSSDWWDGQVHSPCLVVRGGRRHRLLRVVETGGEAVVVPFDRHHAGQWLAHRRKPTRVELGIPAPRWSDEVVVDGVEDFQRCTTPTCGALLRLGTEETCPLCGGQPSPRSAAENAAR